MAAANENWQRWVFASLFDAIKTDLDAASVEHHFHLSRKSRTPSWEAATSKAEILVNGPRTRRVSPTRHLVYVDLFAVVTTKMNDANNYGHEDTVGEIVKAFDKCFTVMDYGDTGLVQVGILQLRDDVEGIDVTDLAPAEEDISFHSTILSRYHGRFDQ